MVIATSIETPTKFARYKVTDGVAIPLGTLLQLSGADLYALASSDVAANQKFAGIAWEEKTASDGITEITAATEGLFDIGCHAGAGITLGTHVSLSGTNAIRTAVEADYPLGLVLGRALETADASETIRVRVGGLI